jgi:hypothetical protein
MAPGTSTRTVRKATAVKSSMRFLKTDRDAAHKIISAGWATTFTGAVRYALKLASDQVSK